MREHGHWTSWGSGVDYETWDRADVIVSQYLHDPRTAADWARWGKDASKVLVWEADDDITTCHTSPAHGSAYDDPATLPRMLGMLESADLVTVTTKALAEVYRPYNPRIAVLPNRVPDWMPDLGYAESEGGRFVLGYTGSASHFEDFADWSAVYAKWMARNSWRTTLALWGHDARPVNAPLSWHITARPWQKDTSVYLRSLHGAMDVGLAFLRDTQFNSGKSPIKAMEYAAAGIPCIASDHPIYRDVVKDGVTGFLCRTQKDWLDAIGELYHDPQLRRDMGQAAQVYAAARFTMGPLATSWADTYRAAGARKGVEL
jgi:hypothetical protein